MAQERRLVCFEDLYEYTFRPSRISMNHSDENMGYSMKILKFGA
jgi:hypothetical protein